MRVAKPVDVTFRLLGAEAARLRRVTKGDQKVMKEMARVAMNKHLNEITGQTIAPVPVGKYIAKRAQAEQIVLRVLTKEKKLTTSIIADKIKSHRVYSIGIMTDLEKQGLVRCSQRKGPFGLGGHRYWSVTRAGRAKVGSL